MAPGGNYATIQYSYANDTSINVYLKNADGSSYTGGMVTWLKVRVVVVPTSSVFKTSNVIDYSNYEEVAKFYNIED